MPSTFALVATAVITIYGSLYVLLHYTQDANEPPPISTSLPFIGTVIQLSRKKTKFYIELRNKHDLPIYTLRLPGARLCVVNSLALIPAVQRQYKDLAFPPLEAMGAMSVCGSSKTANDILNTNINGDEGDWGYSMTFYKTIHKPLAPGPELDAMNRVMAQKVAASVDGIKGERSVRLFDFIKREIAMATTESVYGPQNPFKDPVVADGFWKFQPGVMILLMGLFPSIFARESLQAREYMAKAFNKYFKNGGHDEGSALIKARFNHSTEHKIPVDDIARFEVGNTIGLLSNTSPSAFWMAYHLYSDPAVLEDCRQELAKVISEEMTTMMSGEIVKIRTLDMSRVKVDCPILLSTLQEVLRVHSTGISARMVMKDYMLDGKYLLKKGSTVMIPGPVQHTSASSWGPNVEVFDHRRFLPENKRHNPISFRGFGGGTTLCPGRHFASTEILAFTALLILRFDIAPVDGKWVHLTTNNVAMWETSAAPDEDIAVRISPRTGEELGIKWRVLVSDSDKAMPLSAEDL
ncbi:hypothetical protein OCU04_002921 [Sclerotinia nivalis]|uniref:Cytochrome P450 n=1 Tax=Sclerotinia nivalis TaxID=352851 RepID=A0A9X0DPL2_9HELO|nr:hypothetical protein OCU04_002921 [Sclerotinia nivalis]